MATDAPEESSVEEAAGDRQESSTSARRFNLKSKTVRIVGLLFVIMIIEAAVIYLLLPQPSSEAGDDKTASATADPAETETANLNINTVEVHIDKFNTTNSKADPNSVIHISFELSAIVAEDNSIEFNNAANKQHQARVRQAIEKVCRSSSLEDLNDPNLSTIKRLIRDEVNKVLRKSYIIEVVITDFKTMAQ